MATTLTPAEEQKKITDPGYLGTQAGLQKQAGLSTAVDPELAGAGFAGNVETALSKMQTDANASTAGITGTDGNSGSTTAEQKQPVNVLSPAPADAYIKDTGDKTFQMSEQLKKDTAAADEKIRSLLDYNKQQADRFQQNVQSGYDVQKKKIEEDIGRQRSAIEEQQKEQVATEAASAFYGGRAGTPYADSAVYKTATQYKRQYDILASREADLLNNAWDSALRNEVGLSQRLLGEAQTSVQERQRLRDKERAEQDQYMKIQQFEDTRATTRENKASNTLDNLAKAGFTPDQIPKSYLDNMDSLLDKPPGYSAKMLETSKAEQDLQKETDAEKLKQTKLNSAKAIISLFQDTKEGGTVSIAGKDYTVLGKKPDYYQGMETDSKTGEAVYFQVDPNDPSHVITTRTGIFNKDDGWKLTKDGAGNPFWENDNTKQLVPAIPGGATTAWEQVFPAGSIGPALNPNSPNRGQCGAAANYWYGQNIWTDTFEEKKAELKANGIISPEQVQVGDSFLMSASKTGHVGIINQVTKTPDGKTVIKVTESNFEPPRRGKVSHSRTMTVDDPRIVGFTRIATPNLPTAGPDAPVQQWQTEKSSAGVNKPLTATELKAKGLDPTDPDNFNLTLDQAQAKARELKNKPATPEPPGSLLYLPSKEDFLKQKQDEMAASGKTDLINPKEIDKEYAAQQESVKSTQDALNAIKRGKYAVKSGEKEEFIQQANDFITSGDFDSFENLLDQVGQKSMLAAQRGLYQESKNLVDTYQSGMDMLKYFSHDKNFSTGNIKSIIEKAKKTGQFNADPQYTQLTQLIGEGQASYKHALYGSALTPQEIAQGASFLIDPAADTPKTMRTKLVQGKKLQQFAVDAALAGALGMKRPKLADYLKAE